MQKIAPFFGLKALRLRSTAFEEWPDGLEGIKRWAHGSRRSGKEKGGKESAEGWGDRPNRHSRQAGIKIDAQQAGEKPKGFDSCGKSAWLTLTEILNLQRNKKLRKVAEFFVVRLIQWLRILYIPYDGIRTKILFIGPSNAMMGRANETEIRFVFKLFESAAV
jgi:hypothetical protein